MPSKAKDIMSSPVITVRPETTVDDALGLMLQHHVSGLPVVDAENRIVGIISQFDLLKPLYDQLQLTSTSVTKYMSTKVHTVKDDDFLIDVAEVFISFPIRRVPVVRDGKLVGVISRRDIVRYIRDVRRQVTEEWRASHPLPPE